MRRVVVVVMTVGLAGCSYLGSMLPKQGPVMTQHPGFACDSSYAGPLAGAIASLMTMNPQSLVAATSIGVSACQAEASLVNGPPAVTTTVSSTTSTVQKP